MLTQYLFLFFLLTAYIPASDKWEVPAGNANHEELDRILTRSPWAQTVEATMDDPADEREEQSGVPPEVTQAGLPANARLGATPRWDGGIAKNRMGHLATIPVTVRWDSAAISRRALELTHDSAFAKINAASASDYVITVSGLLPANAAQPPATLQTKSSSDGAAPARTTEEMLEWFMSNSHLFVRKETRLQPDNVVIDPASGTLHLFFKRSADLTAHKRDVYFTTRYGSMNLQTKFHIKDMMVDGRPDL